MHLMICSLPSSFNNALVESNVVKSGRAEHSTKVIGIEFVDAHVPLSLSQMLLRVDVPRFELGASTMPR